MNETKKYGTRKMTEAEKSQDRNIKAAKKLVKSTIVICVLIVVLGGCFYTVPAGHRGVLLTFGDPSMDAKEEGLHFKIPIAQKNIRMEVRTQKVEAAADSASKDLQDVQTTIALNFHIDPKASPRLYKEIGRDYGGRIINPAIQESVKAATAEFKAEELITRRPEVRNQIKELLRIRLEKYYITVDDLNIVNFQFSEEFDKAIEQKVTAEQLKLKAEMDLQRIVVEKQQMITQAEAQAQALKIQKKEITPELIRLREVENEKLAIEKWDGILPRVTSGMPFFDITEQAN